MNKKDFYIYQEDLIRYKISQSNITISQLVEDLNKYYCQENMQKLRTEKITNYLSAKGYLFLNEEMKKRPTLKGKLLGIEVERITQKNGQLYEVNLYNERAKKYIFI